VELNKKDMIDILAILLDHEPGAEAPGQLDVAYLAGLTGRDWGLFTTLSDNLARSREQLAEFLQGNEAVRVEQRVGLILQTMQAAPKSLRWRTRATVGRRMEWFDLPDEVRR